MTKELPNDLSLMLLNGVQKTEEFDEYKIYFVNKEIFFKLWDLREEKVAELMAAGLSEKKAYKEALPVNILNPNKEGVVFIRYSKNKAYELVKNKEKVKKYVIRAFSVWANKQRVMAKKAAKKISTNETEIKKHLDKVESNIKITQEELNKYLNNDEYEIIFTNYNVLPPNKRWSGNIIAVTSDDKNTRLRLHKTRINIIYTIDKHVTKREYPSFVEKELSQADKVLFDKVFIRRKND